MPVLEKVRSWGEWTVRLPAGSVADAASNPAYSSPWLGAPLREFTSPHRASTAKTRKLISLKFRMERYAPGAVSVERRCATRPLSPRLLRHCWPVLIIDTPPHAADADGSHEAWAVVARRVSLVEPRDLRPALGVLLPVHYPDTLPPSPRRHSRSSRQ